MEKYKLKRLVFLALLLATVLIFTACDLREPLPEETDLIVSVHDRETGEWLPGVNLTVRDAKEEHQGVSGSKGRKTFRAVTLIPGEAYSIEASGKAGYLDSEKDFTASSGEINFTEVLMEKAGALKAADPGPITGPDSRVEVELEAINQPLTTGEYLTMECYEAVDEWSAEALTAADFSAATSEAAAGIVVASFVEGTVTLEIEDNKIETGEKIIVSLDPGDWESQQEELSETLITSRSDSEAQEEFTMVMKDFDRPESFQLTVGDITAGESPVLEITDAVDNFDNILDDEYEVSWMIQGTAEDETTEMLEFTDGFLTHDTEEYITDADEYLMEVTVEAAIETAEFKVEADEVASLTAEDINVAAGGEAEITVTAVDEYNNPVADEIISVVEADGLEELTGEVETDAEGAATFSFTEETAGVYYPVFSAEDETITATAEVTVEEENNNEEE